jgi:hypothetical protein
VNRARIKIGTKIVLSVPSTFFLFSVNCCGFDRESFANDSNDSDLFLLLFILVNFSQPSCLKCLKAKIDCVY